MEASLIFGCNLGEIILLCGEDCCPYFKTTPRGQDYLAIGMDRVQAFFDEWTGKNEKDSIIIRSPHFYAGERGVEPFDHIHGDGEHLERVDCS